MSIYRIAIVVRWFGPLPGYFPAWLHSVEMNPDIDFFLFCDREINSNKENIHIIKSSLEIEEARATQALHEEVRIPHAYKLCDTRPFIGVIYQDYLKNYDFWGYCDIDLVFGQIRHFLTDEILSQYERFYEWGHLSVFRNNEKMNHLYELPGAICSRDEVLRRPESAIYDENYGINRVCKLNSITWYKLFDYADFWVCYPDLQLSLGRQNYEHQVFYWEDGRAYRAAVDDKGNVVTNEYIYIHWLKRRPLMDDVTLSNNAFYITSEKLVMKETGVPDAECIMRMAPGLDKATRKKLKGKYIRSKLVEFVKAPWGRKKIWLRQKLALLKESGTLLVHGSCVGKGETK